MMADIIEFRGPKGSTRVEPLPDGRYRVSVAPSSGLRLRRASCVTAYPLPLIEQVHAAKDVNVCDEISREEDPGYVEHHIRKEVLTYLEADAFAGRRVLDFGCGSGASTLVLSRILPPCEIVGIELDGRLLEVARARARHFGRASLTLLQSPSGDSLPPDLGQFDFIMFNAVFEHLLPNERPRMLSLIWRHLRPGGVLFLNQTPYRFSPVEMHTTGLPLINYLPDAAALRIARRFCKRVSPDETWQSLLRRGIRGGTVPEIVGILGGSGQAELLRPLPEVGDRIDLWLGTLSRRHAGLKRSLWVALKSLKFLTGREITPGLSLAIRKAAHVQ
jgi:SAM-dependent methyltransferase